MIILLGKNSERIKSNSTQYFEDQLPHLDIPGSHQPPALSRDLSDHDGDAVPVVSGPVRHLALLTTVGDGVTLGALGELLLASDGLVTRETLLAVSQWLDVRLRHLCYD